MTNADQQIAIDDALASHRGQETFDEVRDGGRLFRQCQDVFDAIRGGHWFTLAELSDATGHPQASVSARLRDLRKVKFGGHSIARDYVANGLWRYRLQINVEGKT